MQLFVHILDLPDFSFLEYLRAVLNPAIRLTSGPDIPIDCEVLVVGRPHRDHLLASPKLRALVIPWAGLPEGTLSLLHEFPGLTVHNIHHNAVPVAEMGMALLLAAAKLILPIDRIFRASDWTPRYQADSSMLMEGKTVLILGYGSIGRHIARMCHGFGMRVMATKRHLAEASGSTDTQGEVSLFSPDAMHQLLPQANVLMICVPHTPQTHGLIGARELALLPPHAILVNISRGPIVEEMALYQALCERTLAAAALDVWYTYPTDPTDEAQMHIAPSTAPFHQLDNVIMSPHRAGRSRETERLRMVHVAALLNEAALGKSIPNQINIQRGY